MKMWIRNPRNAPFEPLDSTGNGAPYSVFEYSRGLGGVKGPLNLRFDPGAYHDKINLILPGRAQHFLRIIGGNPIVTRRGGMSTFGGNLLALSMVLPQGAGVFAEG